MNKLEIAGESLKISNNGVVILLVPKNACAINVLSLSQAQPRIIIYNKSLANFSELFNQFLSLCVDSTNTPFSESSFISFAENNLGF
jgi:hypothetical protein